MISCVGTQIRSMKFMKGDQALGFFFRMNFSVCKEIERVIEFFQS